MRARLGPESWSVFKRQIRTNNDTEGWHNSLNSGNKGKAPSVYAVIEILSGKSKDARLEQRMLEAGLEVRNVRPAARAHNEALNELWLRYENKELSPRMFLQAVVEMKDGGRLQGD